MIEIKPGPLTPKTASMLTDLLNRLIALSPPGSLPLPQENFGGGIFTGDLIANESVNIPFRAILVDGPDPNGFYSWYQVLSQGNWQPYDGGLVGSNGTNYELDSSLVLVPTNPAYEANGIIVPPNTTVQLRRAYLDPNMNWVYTFDAVTGVAVGQCTSTSTDANGLWQFTLQTATTSTATPPVTSLIPTIVEGVVNPATQTAVVVDVLDTNNILTANSTGIDFQLTFSQPVSASGSPLYLLAEPPGVALGIQSSTGTDAHGFYQATLKTANSSGGTAGSTTVDVKDLNSILTTTTGFYLSLLATGQTTANGRSEFVFAQVPASVTGAAGSTITGTYESVYTGVFPIGPVGTGTGNINSIIVDNVTGLYATFSATNPSVLSLGCLMASPSNPGVLITADQTVGFAAQGFSGTKQFFNSNSGSSVEDSYVQIGQNVTQTGAFPSIAVLDTGVSSGVLSYFGVYPTQPKTWFSQIYNGATNSVTAYEGTIACAASGYITVNTSSCPSTAGADVYFVLTSSLSAGNINDVGDDTTGFAVVSEEGAVSYGICTPGSGIDRMGNSFWGGLLIAYGQSATSSAPAHSTSTGVEGAWAWDSTNLYFCVASDTWIKIAGNASF